LTNHTLKKLITPPRDDSSRNLNKPQTPKQKTNPKQTHPKTKAVGSRKKEELFYQSLSSKLHFSF
jgi:hypothetical protein